MAAVTSRTNPRVKAVVALHRRKGRRASGRHLLEGPNVVAEALSAGVVETVFGTDEALGQLSVPTGVEVVEVTGDVLDRLADTPSPQGLVAVAHTVTAEPRQLPVEELLVVLDGLADPGNVGTIVRTADAVGAGGVWLTPSTADVFSPKAVRAAAGSTYHLPLVVGAELDELLETCRDHGRRLLGLDAGARETVFELGDGPVALVLGNEAHGLDEEVRGRLDGMVRVPMRGRAESLNVASAAALAIYGAAGEFR